MSRHECGFQICVERVHASKDFEVARVEAVNAVAVECCNDRYDGPMYSKVIVYKIAICIFSI